MLTGKELVEDLKRFDDTKISFHLGATEVRRVSGIKVGMSNIIVDYRKRICLWP